MAALELAFFNPSGELVRQFRASPSWGYLPRAGDWISHPDAAGGAAWTGRVAEVHFCPLVVRLDVELEFPRPSYH